MKQIQKQQIRIFGSNTISDLNQQIDAWVAKHIERQTIINIVSSNLQTCESINQFNYTISIIYDVYE